MKILRSVIILDVSLKLDEIDIPYKMFLSEYRGQIIKRIKQDKGWTTTKASNFLSSKFMYDAYVYSVMQRVIDELQPHVIINRNPTITYGSILEMKIRRVKRDSDDLTISLPSAILPGLQVIAQALSPGLPNTCLTAGISFDHGSLSCCRNAA